MNKRIRRIAAVLVAMATITMISSEAMADCGCRGFNGARGFGYSGTLYGLGYIPVPPYHAIHPPVYYGQRVRRSYGLSPFARQPVQAKAEKAKPRMVVNRTMKQEKSAKPVEKAASFQTVSSPKMIINPYFSENAARGRLVTDQK